MTTVSLLALADAEYQEAYDWYFARSARAAAGFREAVENALQFIVDAPEQWPLWDDRHRYQILKQ